MTLDELNGTTWTGESELWLDPLGDHATRSTCTIAVDANVVRYTWIHEASAHEGSFDLAADSATFTDSWHQPTAMPCTRMPGRSLFDVEGTYQAGDGPDWGWRSTLSYRPFEGGMLVLQMTNIAPWGETARAVRMVCRRNNAQG